MTTKAKTAYDFPAMGCYVDESSGSADDCNLRTIEFAQAYGFEAGEIPEHPNDPDGDAGDYAQSLSELGDKAVDYLNSLETRSFMFWQFEDNSLFLSVDVDTARGDVGFVSVKSLADARRMGIETDPEDSSFPPADYEGEWLHVSDHGNATLYVREAGKDKEIWAVV